MVHQFKREPKNELDNELLSSSYKQNKKDWKNYLRFLGVKKISDEFMYGPFYLNENSKYISSSIPFFVTSVQMHSPLAARVSD